LLKQRENDWIHKKQEMNAKTISYQTKMLENQEKISMRMLRDGQAMKAFAYITAIFLPATSVAVCRTSLFIDGNY
jgi:hypothetical protein